MKRSPLPVVAWLLALALLFSYVLWLGPALPPRIASHFGAAGQANGWDTRSHYLALYLTLAAAVTALIVGFSFALPHLPPDLLNVPNAPYWRSPEHYPEACALAQNLLGWIGVVLTLWFAGLHALVVQANRARPPHLDGRALGALTAVLMAAIIALAWNLRRQLAARRKAHPPLA